MIKGTNYVTIQGWMITELGLKGNELIIYAVIYGFSQVEGQAYKGSRQYLAEWTNSTKQGVDRALKALVDKGLLSKIDTHINGVKFCSYQPTKLSGGSQQSCPGGSQQSCPNNYNKDNNTDNKERKKEGSFDSIIEAYTKDKEIADLLRDWLRNRKAKRAAMTDSAIQKNIDKLDRFAAESKMTVKAYLDEVVRRGWAAFFPINQPQFPPLPKGKPARGTPIITGEEYERQSQETPMPF